MEDKSGKYLRESDTTWGYERGFGAPDVCNGVGFHWVDNIKWMRVTSDLEITTADWFASRLVWPGNPN